MRKLLPIVLLLVGLGAGFGAGTFMAPPPPDCPADADAEAPLPEACEDPTDNADEAAEQEAAPTEFVRMNDQFVIPVLDDGVVRSLVVLSVTLEVAPGTTAAVFEIEPKLRDNMLRVLFDHANAGGFSGAYTAAGPMERLRRALLETARKVAGSNVREVLILDLLRQEV